MSKYIEFDKISQGIEAICKDEKSSISAMTYFSLIAFINKMPTIEAEPMERGREVRELIRMYLENISEDIDRTKESIARLEGKLTALNIEYGRLESIQEHFNGGGNNE